MPILHPMSAEAFESYLANAITSYANENTRSGRWTAAEATARSTEDHLSLLPQGQATPDNHFFEIRDPATEAVAGSLWVAILTRGGVRSAYVYGIDIDESHRRRGLASRALEALEDFARDHGLPSIGLHVFAHNTGAQALYKSLGFSVTGFNMQKSIAPKGA